MAQIYGEFVTSKKYGKEKLYHALSGWVDLIEGMLNNEIRFFPDPADAQRVAHAIQKKGISCMVEEVR